MTDHTQARGIRVLPLHLANQIAAGEVVQRPESVVKELVENAIDAGASHVTVIIGQAGKSLIQVIDDGSGMTEEDVLLAFERHATSKIESFDDLEQIMTFGFRGEALPSIAAVGQVEVRSRVRSEDTAVSLRMSAGTVEERSREQGDVGTSIAVKNLFFNTPARRNFLKANSTEYRHIVDTVQRYILSYPELHVTFIVDNQTVYDARPGDLRTRIGYLFGERIAESLVEVHEETDMITVTGFVGRPSFAKKSRGEQFMFVNGRYIVSRMMNHAVVSAYEQLLDQGAFPMYMLFLNVNPRQVDVNVHPQKLEVKFSNERNIYTIINAVVRQSLFRADLSPHMQFREEGGGGNAAADGTDRLRIVSPEEAGGSPEPAYDSFASLGRSAAERGAGERGGAGWSAAGAASSGAAPERGAGGRMDPQQIDDLFRALDAEQVAGAEDGDRETLLIPSEKPVSDQSFLWQLHNKYIFTPIKTGLMIIDQHVAHERILYEKALAAMNDAAPFAQQLLFPHVTQVSPGDFALLQDLREEFEHLGFVLKLEGADRVHVEAVPQDVRVGMEEGILQEMLEQYREYDSGGMTETRHMVAASYGCKAAIKSGDKMTAQEMQMLIDQLFATSNPYVCPHGRPIVIKLSLGELDRRFGRSS